MRNYFEEMNIDYDELKRYEDIETYYDEVQDYSKLIQELQCDRVEVLKQIVNKNKEIERLHSIINEFMEELKWQRKVSLSLNEAFAVSRIDTLINKLQELKGSDKE